MAVIALETALSMEAMAVRAVLLTAVVHVRVRVQLRSALTELLIGNVASEASFLSRGLELVVDVAGRAGHRLVRAVDRGRHASSDRRAREGEGRGSEEAAKSRLQGHLVSLLKEVFRAS